MGLFRKENKIRKSNSQYQNISDVLHDKYLFHSRYHMDTLSNMFVILQKLATLDYDADFDKILYPMINFEISMIKGIKSSIDCDLNECNDIPNGNEIKDFLNEYNIVCENMKQAFECYNSYIEEKNTDYLVKAEQFSALVTEFLDQLCDRLS